MAQNLPWLCNAMGQQCLFQVLWACGIPYYHWILAYWPLVGEIPSSLWLASWLLGLFNMGPSLQMACATGPGYFPGYIEA
jgi:hypothetical protein